MKIVTEKVAEQKPLLKNGKQIENLQCVRYVLNIVCTLFNSSYKNHNELKIVCVIHGSRH